MFRMSTYRVSSMFPCRLFEKLPLAGEYFEAEAEAEADPGE